jgi:hypothetical protein
MAVTIDLPEDALERLQAEATDLGVARADNERWSLYGARRRTVATGRKALAREDGSIKPRPLPPVATNCRLKRMVRVVSLRPPIW